MSSVFCALKRNVQVIDRPTIVKTNKRSGREITTFFSKKTQRRSNRKTHMINDTQYQLINQIFFRLSNLFEVFKTFKNK